MVNIRKFGEFRINESITINNRVAPFSLDNRPSSDRDIKIEKDFIISAIKKFDEIFGTDYYQKFGTDFRLLVGKEVFFSKEIVESLVNESLKEEVNVKFNLLQNDDENTNTLYDNLMRVKLNSISDGDTEDDNDTDSKALDFITSLLPSKINKSELYYRLFKKVGSEFDDELIKDILEVKHSFDLKGDGRIMKKDYQRVFLESMKKTMLRYVNKVKKNKSNFINTEEFFKYTFEEFSEKEISENIRRDYLKKRLNDWVKYLKDVTS